MSKIDQGTQPLGYDVLNDPSRLLALGEAATRATAIVDYDLQGRILTANEAFLALTGSALSEITGRAHDLTRAAKTDESSRWLNGSGLWNEILAQSPCSGLYCRPAADGTPVYVRAHHVIDYDASGQALRVVEFSTNITDEHIALAEHQGQTAAIQKSLCVISFALDGTILDANENFLKPLGYTLDEVKGRHHRMFVEPDHAASAEYGAFWDTLRSGSFVSGLYKRLGKNGQVVWIQASYNPINDLDGRPYKIVKYSGDVTENVALAAAYEESRKQNQLDPATALPNRHRLLAFMRDALAHREQSLVILYLDLDRFKPVNDTYGHDVGDYVLAQIADRLRRALTREQLAARLGGDEFVIAAPDLSPDLNDDEITQFCDRLIERISAPILHNGVEIRVGVSIGAATSNDATEPDDMLRCADIALYRSTATNRGGLSFYAASMHDRLQAFRGLVHEISVGLAERQFFVEFQPRFRTSTRTMQSVEALVRWNHPERGRVPPVEFIPTAEKSGLISELGAWVLHEACTAVLQWPSIGVSVNVSPVQFRDGNIVAAVTRTLALAQTGLDPTRLELEVTESILLSDAGRALSTLLALKALGVRIAMDDFGTGFSSLSSLRTFPFDVLKIDRQFIADMDDRKGGRETVQAILGLGRALGLSVTAEGVESDRQLEMLTDDACSEVQGYLLGRPTAAADITALLARVQPVSAPVLEAMGAA